jgi:hypothetical protein
MTTNLQDWINNNPEDEGLLWGKAALTQAIFVRDNLAPLVTGRAGAEVISTHRSKSCELPVYQLNHPRQKLFMTMRGNFYDWKVSVTCPLSVSARLLHGLHNPDSGLLCHAVYFEGFPDHLVYPPLRPEVDSCMFSLETRSNYSLWAITFLLARHVGFPT